MLKLWNAISRVSDAANALADSFFELAKTFGEANVIARERLALDAQPEVTAETPALVEPKKTKKSA